MGSRVQTAKQNEQCPFCKRWFTTCGLIGGHLDSCVSRKRYFDIQNSKKRIRLLEGNEDSDDDFFPPPAGDEEENGPELVPAPPPTRRKLVLPQRNNSIITGTIPKPVEPAKPNPKVGKKSRQHIASEKKSYNKKLLVEFHTKKMEAFFNQDRSGDNVSVFVHKEDFDVMNCDDADDNAH